MEKLCIKSFKKDGMIFAEGCTYKFNYNPINGCIYVHSVWGYTDISKTIINEYFL